MNISASTLQRIIKKVKEPGEITLAREKAQTQYRMPVIFEPSDGIALKMGMTLYFQTSPSVNTLHLAIQKCKLKLCRAKKRPYTNRIQKCLL